ncbi:MAG TPA: carboxymuconolactone decarboxylase family protein [Mycobacteriales bacterium]|nr:carboxymuconolactone decarboxylase family protein [Mycobacteriales bacterium]
MFIDAAPDEAAEGPLRSFYDQQRASWGFLPNYAFAFATRPDVAAAWNQLNGAIRGGMERRRYEIATIAAARALRSTYCTAAHAKFLRDDCDDEATLQALSTDPTGATLGDVDRAVYAFAGKVATDAASVQQEDVDALRAVGLSDAEVADVVFAAAARSFFTRVLDGLGAQLDHQTAATFDPSVREGLVVGRPPAPAPA